MRRGHSVTTDPAARSETVAESRRVVSPLRGWIGLAGDTALIVGVTGVVVAFYVGLVVLVVELWTAKNDMSLRILVTILAAACFVPLVRSIRSRIRNRKQVDLDLVAAEQLEARRAAIVARTARRETRSPR